VVSFSRHEDLWRSECQTAGILNLSTIYGGEWSASHVMKAYGGVNVNSTHSESQYEIEVSGNFHLSAILHPVPTAYGTGKAPHPE